MQSVALRIGRSWRWDPDVLARLVEASAGGVERTLRQVRDTLEVLVGGRNIAADASEDALFPVLYDLLRALGDLHRGGRRKAIIPFRDEPWELVIERRADEGRLSFYGAGATRVVAARDASVHFPELVREVAGAAATLADELESLCPSWRTDPYLRAFRDAASALLSSPPRPLGDLPTSPPSWRTDDADGRRRPVGALRGLRICMAPDLGDEGLRSYDGEHAYDLHSLLCVGDVRFQTRQTERTLAGGYPFLAAESLITATESALGAIEGEPGRDEVPLGDGLRLLRMTVDGRKGQVRLDGDTHDWGRPLTCTVPQFAIAALTAAQQLADSILERNPAHRDNRRLTDLLAEIADLQGWLDDLTQHAPVGAGASAQQRPGATPSPRVRERPAVLVHAAGLRCAWSVVVPGLDARRLRRCGGVLAGVADGRLQLLDTNIGAPAGNLADDEAPVVSVASAGQRALVGRQDGELLCYAPGQGVRWAAQLEGPGAVASLSAIPAGRGIAVAGGDGKLRMFNADSGCLRWRFEAHRAAGFRLLSDDRRVYAAGDDRSLYALSREDGSLLWRVRCGGGFALAPALLPTGALLALTGDGVVPEGRALALDPDDGRILWETRIGDACARPATLDGGGLLVCTREGDKDSLVRLDVATGRVRWRRSWACLGIDDPPRPLVVDGRACVKDDVGVVRAFDAADGEPAWSVDLTLDGRVEAVDNLDLAAGRGLIYAVTDRMVVLCAETGDELSEAAVRIQGPSSLLALGPRRLILAHDDRIEAWQLGRYLGLVAGDPS